MHLKALIMHLKAVRTLFSGTDPPVVSWLTVTVLIIPFVEDGYNLNNLVSRRNQIFIIAVIGKLETIP